MHHWQTSTTNSTPYLRHDLLSLVFGLDALVVVVVPTLVVVVVVGRLKPLEEDVQHGDFPHAVADGGPPGLVPLVAGRGRHKTPGLVALAHGAVVVVVVVVDVVVVLLLVVWLWRKNTWSFKKSLIRCKTVRVKLKTRYLLDPGSKTTILSETVGHGR